MSVNKKIIKDLESAKKEIELVISDLKSNLTNEELKTKFKKEWKYDLPDYYVNELFEWFNPYLSK